MATKRISNLVDKDMDKRELPRRPRTPRDERLIPHTILLSKSDQEDLKEIARRKGISFNGTVRMALKEFLARNH
jgi:CheY-like chemotaxis protein